MSGWRRWPGPPAPSRPGRRCARPWSSSTRPAPRRCGSEWRSTSWRPRRWPGEKSVRPSWPRRPSRRRARWPGWRPRPRWYTGGWREASWREGGWRERGRRGGAGVIRRVFHGRSPYGLVRYLYGEGRRNEHTEPHLIASWDDDPAGLEPAFVPALDRPVGGCDRAPQQWVYHLVLRNDAADRRLSDEEWAQVCTAAVERNPNFASK